MVDATSCLNDEEMNRSMAVIRMDMDPGDSFSKWCILMYTKGNGNMSRVSSEVAIRERHIVSPTRRNRKTGKGRFKQFIDECNLRFDRPTAERSESRDKMIILSGR